MYQGLLLSAAVSPSKKIMDVGYNVAEISKVDTIYTYIQKF